MPRISNKASYKGKHLKIVADYLALPKPSMQANYWEDDSLKGLRRALKSFYMKEQKLRCCYCDKLVLTRHKGMWQAEHIQPRVARPDFMFEPLNIAIACPDCNIAKSDNSVLLDNNVKDYPSKGSDFSIVHPHFDEYLDHIRLLGEYVYVPKTDKGRKTIYMCNLLRFSVMAADLGEDISDDRYEKIADMLFSNQNDKKIAALASVLREISAQDASK